MKNLLHKIIDFFTNQEEKKALNEEIMRYESLLGLKGRTGKEIFYDLHFRDNPATWRYPGFEGRRRYLQDLKEKLELGYKSPEIIGGTAVRIIENYEGCELYGISKPPSGCYKDDIFGIKIHIILVRKDKYENRIPQKYISNPETIDCITTWKECDNLEDYYVIEKITPNNQLIKDIIYDYKKKISRTRTT